MYPLEHISLYRQRASEMEMLAAATKFPRMRESYLHLADEWNLLAEGLEQQTRRVHEPGAQAPLRS